MLRSALGRRLLIGAALGGAAALGGLLVVAPLAGAQTASTSATTSTTTPAAGTAAPGASAQSTSSLNGAALGSTARQLSASAAACQRQVEAISKPGPGNAGSPKGSDFHICVNGELVAYGNSAITYRRPPNSYIAAGEALFAQNCSSCHEPGATGGPNAPPLIGVSSATVDFWVSTGRMPAATERQVQAEEKPPRLTNRQAQQIAAYINSLAPSAPFIPTVNVKGADLATGAQLFALNCAACHTITGSGDALAYDTYAPSLHSASATQVAEAIRTGPGNMPIFAGNLSDNQVRDVVAYVTEKIQHPSNPGGAGLGGIGPVAEGFVALLFGVGIFVLICYWIGDRA